MKIESYIFFTDQCAEAMRFYEKALGGKIEAMMKYGDSPAGPHNPPEMADKVIHARLVVGNAVLMASDGPEAESRKGFAVALQVDTGRRHDHHADRRDVLLQALRHADRPLRRPLDGELRTEVNRTCPLPPNRRPIAC